MLLVNTGGHTAYQDTFVSDFLKFYPNLFALPKSTWDYIVQFWYLNLSMTDSILQTSSQSGAACSIILYLRTRLAYIRI